MDSIDNVPERFEALEQRTEQLHQHTRTVERRLRWWRIPWKMAAVVALGLALALPLPVQAKTFHCGAGDVQCLIDAINAANANGQKNTIRLEAGTYTLTAVDNTAFGANGLPTVTGPLTITGEGAETTIIERDASAPRFRIVDVAATSTLTLRGLTLKGGFDEIEGGGIRNAGTLTIIKSTIASNFVQAGAGGGISNRGTLTITKSTIADNFAFDSGGGLKNDFTSSTSVGPVVITTTTFARNRAGSGGAISNGSFLSPSATGGPIVLTDSAFFDNGSSAPGGAIANTTGGTVYVLNTTFARNEGGLGGPVAAAIENRGTGTVILTNSTIFSTTGRRSYSAIVSEMTAPTLLVNTIIASRVGSAGQGFDCRGTVTSLGNNLFDDPTGCTITLQPSDLTGDPGLDIFTDNGRPGNGHFPLLSTSQAIDAGNDAVCPRTDQLGRRRIGPCDIGAIEFRHRDDRQHDEEDDQHDEDPATAAD